MSEPGKGGEPSMDEILASIRRIISDDPAQERPDRRAVNPLVEPPRRPPGFIDLPAPRDARPLPPADRFSGALRASAVSAPPPMAASPPSVFDADLEDLLEGPPEPLVPPGDPVLPVPAPDRAATPAAIRPAPSDQSSEFLKSRDRTSWAGQQLDQDSRARAEGVPAAKAVTAPDPVRPASAHRAPSFLPLDPRELVVTRPAPHPREPYQSESRPSEPEPPTARIAPASSAGDVPPASVTATRGMEKPDDVSALETTAHEPSGYTLDSFPSLPGDHDNALAGLSDRDAAPAAGPHGTAADAMPITPHETGHAEAGMNGAVATLPPEPMKSEPAPAGGPEPVRSYLSAVPSAVDAPPATATTAPSISVALDRDAQAAAAVALGALAAGLAAAPAGASPPQAAAPAAPPAAPSDAAPPPAAPPAVAPQAGTAAPVPAAQPSAAEAAPLPVPASQGQTRGLEDIIAEMARPMLERWISDNMPRIMEKALRGELKSKKP